MARLKKLVARFLRESPEVAFGDVERLLHGFGFLHRRGKGSHHIFYRGDLQISVPTVRGARVKRAYVRRLVNLLKLEEWFDAQGAAGDGPEERD